MPGRTPAKARMSMFIGMPKAILIRTRISMVMDMNMATIMIITTGPIITIITIIHMGTKPSMTIFTTTCMAEMSRMDLAS